MKKLSIVCMITIVVLSAGQVFALPGVYRAGSPTMDLYVGQCETRTISMDGTGWGTSPLVAGQFLISQSDSGAAIDITSCQCYDGTLTPAIWNPTTPFFDPTGFPGGLWVTINNVEEGVIPSANILLCDVTFCGVAVGNTNVTIRNCCSWDGWVAWDFTIYLPDPAFINATVSINYCEGDFDYDRDVDGTDAAVFKSDFGRSGLINACPADGPAAVQKTWQTASYATGDDGDLGRGIAWPQPRFADNEDGTVTDNLTGLIWLKNANCFGERTWDQALADANELNNGECGLTDSSSAGDWRLPNLFELESLRDMKYYNPALSNSSGTGQWTEGDPFINVQSGYFYWSSTTFADNSNLAWNVTMYYGFMGGNEKSVSSRVWPVRGGH